MPSLMNTHSPLAQRRHRRDAEPAAATPLASADRGASGPAPAPRRNRRGGALRRDQQQTLDRLLHEKYEYVDHELFHQPFDDAYAAIFLEPDPVPAPDVSWYHPLMDVAGSRMSGSASAARELEAAARRASSGSSGGVLLTAAQERVIFTQFNLCRKQVCDLRDRIADPADDATPRSVGQEMLDWYVRADALRTQIADTNLALVLAMAKRSRIHHGDFADLISEGNMALLRAADKFDVGRGFKFSTYACRAILKAFSRQGIKLSKHRALFPVDFDPKLERSNYQSEKNAAHEQDTADEVRRIVADNRAQLSDVERTVVAARFNVGPQGEIAEPADERPAPSVPRTKGKLSKGDVPTLDFDDEQHEQATDGYELPSILQDRGPDAKPLTLEQVGKLIGVTKERVRQIQNKALEKIRVTLEDEYLG